MPIRHDERRIFDKRLELIAMIVIILTIELEDKDNFVGSFTTEHMNLSLKSVSIDTCEMNLLLFR